MEDFAKFLNDKEKDFIININIYELNTEEIPNDKLKKLENYFNEYNKLNKEKINNKEADKKELIKEKNILPTLDNLIKDGNILLDKLNNIEKKKN